eukprot:5870849-Amphidinium_carterae.1
MTLAHIFPQTSQSMKDLQNRDVKALRRYAGIVDEGCSSCGQVKELKTSTSSMTSVPKPLKFLRPHYS